MGAKVFCLTLEKGYNKKKKKTEGECFFQEGICTHWEQIISFRVESFSEGDWYMKANGKSRKGRVAFFEKEKLEISLGNVPVLFILCPSIATLNLSEVILFFKYHCH